MSLDVQALKAKQEAAEQLPWECRTDPDEEVLAIYHVGEPFHLNLDMAEADADYILAACNALPELIDLLERAAAELLASQENAAPYVPTRVSRELLGSLRAAGALPEAKP